MKRRHLLAGAAGLATGRAALAQPAVGGRSRTLIHVPQASVGSLDPVWTTAVVTRNFAHMVFETLYGRDETLDPKPQMVAGHVVEDGGRRWTMTLRDGLAFHDGSRVLARDCVASLRRWMKRDPIGQTIADRLDALEAKDDRTLVWRLSKPFASLPYALAKTQPSPVIMPERLANTDPFKQVPDIVGSGPFRFVPAEYVANTRLICVKNEKYQPRPEKVSYAAGGYNVLVDRVEWQFIPDAATAANALAAGEVDWIDSPLPDLLPMLRKAPGVTVGVLDTFGTFGALRPNHLQGPTANVGVRRAMLAAIDQTEMMTAAMGEDKSLYRAPVGFFLPGTPSANEAGMENVRRRRSAPEVQAMLKAAGYNGERILLMHPTDQAFYNAFCLVAIQSFRQAGLNVEAQAMDWGTVVQRRASKEPLEKGGWSVFPSGFPAAEYRDPIFATNVRGNGGEAWFGWPTDEKVEAMRTTWMDSTDAGELKRLDAEIQARAFETVPFIPLGQYLPPAAWRTSLKGLLKGPVPVFWNVEKS